MTFMYTRMNENAWPNLQKVNPHHSTRKKKFERRPTEACFLSCGPQKIKENVQSVHHELRHRILHV